MILIKYFSKLRYAILLLLSPKAWFFLVREMRWNLENQSIQKSCSELINWLITTQSIKKKGGYPISFIPKLGQTLSHPFCETTGYIIETLINVGNSDCIDSAIEAGEWLLTMQYSNGSFKTNLGHYEFNSKPLTFDTGMCLFGMIALYNKTNDDKYLISAKRASNWLLGNLDDDSHKFVMGIFNDGPRLYYVKVAYAIYKLSVITGDLVAREKAVGVYLDVLLALKQGGYDRYGFESNFFHLHTLGYILESLLKFAIDLDDCDTIAFINSYLNDEFLINDAVMLYGRKYIATGQADYSYRCLVGECQIAEVYAILGHYLQSETLIHQAEKVLLSVSCEIRPMISGAKTFFASKPLYGAYKPFECTNWGPKFYIDAAIATGLLNR